MEALEAAVEANSLEGVYAGLRQLRTNESIPEYIIKMAVKNRNLEMVAALLGARSRQADAAASYSSQRATLKSAIVTAKDLTITKLLIKVGYEPFAAEDDTALHWAAEAGDLPLLEYVWEVASSRGISINVRGCHGRTPLHRAAYFLKDAAVQFLLQQGANPNALDEDGQSAFSHLLINGRSRKPENAGVVQSITEALITAGLRLEDFTLLDMTPLMEASDCGVTAAVKALLSSGANIDTKFPDDGKTALHFASRGRSVACIRLLLAAGADVNARDVDGNTPLHAACNHRSNMEGRVKTILLELINHRAEINAKNNAGETPLHVACRNIWREGVGTVGALLECGADVSILAPGKDSCLHLVIKALGKECYWALPWNEYRVELAKQRAACALGFIQKLLKFGAKADLMNLEGFTALELFNNRLPAAVLNQHKDIFAPLIVALIKGGDFQSSWGSVPKGCPGLGSAIETVWNNRPEMLSQLFVKMVPGEQERVRMTLRCLQRYLPKEEVRMEIVTKVCSEV